MGGMIKKLPSKNRVSFKYLLKLFFIG